MKWYFILCIVVLGDCVEDLFFGREYKFTQTVELSDHRSIVGGYQIGATAFIERVLPSLLSIKVDDLKLYSKTKDASPDSFKLRTSSLNTKDNNVFFIELSGGVVNTIYISESEKLHLVNIKKSLANLLQFQTTSGYREEEDLNGYCKAKYSVKGESSIEKVKEGCSVDTTLKNNVWSGIVLPQRRTEISVVKNKLHFVKFSEEYKVKSNIAEFAHALIRNVAHLELLDEVTSQSSKVNADDIELYIKTAEEQIGKKYRKHHLTVDVSFENSRESKTEPFEKVLEENRLLLTNKDLGSYSSAVAALKVLRSLKDASHDDLFNALKSKKNKKIIPQLLDLLGAIQTPASHKAAMMFLKLNSKDQNLDFCERYLWALSTSVHQEKSIVNELKTLAESGVSNEKLLETLVLTISAMVRKNYEDTHDEKLLDETVQFLMNQLKNCSKDDDLCQRIYLKSFANLGSPKVMDLLVDYAVHHSKSSNIRAMRALWKLGRDSWNSDVLKAAERIYLSNDTYDSSAKTVALDILLETSKTDADLKRVLRILKDKSTSKELKEYLLQRLSQQAEKNVTLRKSIKKILSSEGLNHYDTLATGGLSTAFDRRFMKNGHLSTAQEVKSGILKQGYVHINMEHGNSQPLTVFTLGLFSNGLGSFVSDDSGDEDDEGVNAGLELTVLGVELRPLIFFNGHGELMGHVFSGAGSTLTPAYQAILLVEDDKTFVPLGTGEVLSVKFSSIASVDLSGKIEISLWSRTAQSLVQNRAGLVIDGSFEILSPIANSQMQFEVSAEPQLKLSANIEFYDKVALCLTLEQPPIKIHHNVTSAMSITGSKYRKTNSKRSNFLIPGRTYDLNSKNNEMCNILFK